jgi:hypothetical protein
MRAAGEVADRVRYGGRGSGKTPAVQWFVVSVVLSLVLTLALNILVRLFPGGARRATNWFDDLGAPRAQARTRSRSGVRVIVPWKAMVAVSIALTVVINVLLWAK